MDKRVFWNIETACCFTGHRNKKLPFNGNREKQGIKYLTSSLQLYIEQAVRCGFNTFISGMADGIDMICAEIVFNLISRKEMKLNLVCAVPFKGHEQAITNPIDKYIYSMITQKSSVIYVNDKKSRDSYKRRNQFMVDNSSLLIGAFNESDKRSGSMQTFNMAKRANLDIKMISIDKNPVYLISEETF